MVLFVPLNAPASSYIVVATYEGGDEDAPEEVVGGWEEEKEKDGHLEIYSGS